MVLYSFIFYNSALLLLSMYYLRGKFRNDHCPTMKLHCTVGITRGYLQDFAHYWPFVLHSVTLDIFSTSYLPRLVNVVKECPSDVGCIGLQNKSNTFSTLYIMAFCIYMASTNKMWISYVMCIIIIIIYMYSLFLIIE